MVKFNEDDFISTIFDGVVEQVKENNSTPVDLNLPDFDSIPRKNVKKEIKYFIENNLKAIKKGKSQKIKLIPQMVDLVHDFLFHETDAGILWKPRGSGGSVCAALVCFFLSVYRSMSFYILGGSKDQSNHVYQYVVGFFSCFPVLSDKLLKKKPSGDKIEFVNGVEIKAVAASQEGSIGEHVPGLIVDESSSKVAKFNELMQRVMGIVEDSDPKAILLCSTFHVATGVFADTWDNAEEKGFRRYNYNIFHAMEKCVEKIDCKDCYLTNKIKTIDDSGTELIKYSGCNGIARNSQGFKPYKMVLNAKKRHRGTDVWDVEFECNRPGSSHKVYNQENIRKCTVNNIFIEKGFPYDLSIGIDWGWTNLTTVVFVVHQKGKCKIVSARHFQQTPVSAISSFIEKEIKKFKKEKEDIVIYADSENQFNNFELAKHDFNVSPVMFGKYKSYGISNIQKWLAEERLEILEKYPSSGNTFYEQLIKYRKNPETGKPIKENDHYPDGFMCAMLNFDYLTMFDYEFETEDETEDEDSVFII